MEGFLVGAYTPGRGESLREAAEVHKNEERGGCGGRMRRGRARHAIGRGEATEGAAADEEALPSSGRLRPSRTGAGGAGGAADGGCWGGGKPHGPAKVRSADPTDGSGGNSDSAVVKLVCGEYGASEANGRRSVGERSVRGVVRAT